MAPQDKRLVRIDEVLQAAASVRARAEYSDFSGGNVEDGEKSGLIARVVNAILECAAPNSSFSQESADLRAAAMTDGRRLVRLLGILSALKTDIEMGYSGETPAAPTSEQVSPEGERPPTSSALEKFRELFEPLKDAYRNIEIRVVAAKWKGELLLVGGEIRFTSELSLAWRAWDTCFESEHIAVVNDLSPVSELNQILTALSMGVFPIGKRIVHLGGGPRDGKTVFPVTACAFDPVPRHAFGELIDERFGLSWTLSKPVEEFTPDWCERMERGLRKHDFGSLQELLAQFIPGHEGGTGRSRNLEVAVPLPIRLSMQAGSDAVIVRIQASETLVRGDLEFRLKFIQGSQSSSKVIGSDPFRIGTEWKQSGRTYDASVNRALPRCDRVQLSAKYRGEQIATSTTWISTTPAPLSGMRTDAFHQGTPEADWSDFKDGMERALTFLDLDVAGHTELMKSDPKRTTAALEVLREVFNQAVKAVGGRMTWLGDGGAAFFVGGGRSDRAVKAAMRTFLESQAAFVCSPEKLMDLPLRAALDHGSTKWFDDTGRIHCDALNWAAHAQKSAGSAPRISASAQLVNELSREIQPTFAEAGTFEGQDFSNWRFLESGGPSPGHGSSRGTGSTPPYSLRQTSGKLLLVEAAGHDGSYDLWIPVTFFNADVQTVALDEVRWIGSLRSMDLHPESSVAVDQQVDRVRDVIRIIPGSEAIIPSKFPFALDPKQSARLLVAIEVGKSGMQQLGGATAGIRLEAEFEAEDMMGRVVTGRISVATK